MKRPKNSSSNQCHSSNERSKEDSHHSHDMDNEVRVDINKGKLSKAPLHKLFPQLNKTKKDLIEAQLGIAIKFGDFSAKEDNILTKNWHKFCDDFIVDMPHMVLGFFKFTTNANKKEIMAANKVVNESHMYLRLGKGLSRRPLSSVYQRARKLFSGLTKACDLSEEDRRYIIREAKKGKKCAEIAAKLYADIKAVEDIVRRNVRTGERDEFLKNKWSKDEDKTFVKVIHDFIIKKEVSEPSELDWTQLSPILGNRSSIQCREHFYRTYIWEKLFPEEEEEYKRWSYEYTQRLVYYIHKHNYQKESHIDWSDIRTKFEGFRHYSIVKNWYRLKTKKGDYETISFSRLMKRLYKKYIKSCSNEKILELEKFVKFGL